MGFEFDQPKKKEGTNLAAPPTKCKLCGGDRYVVANLRSPDTTVWMDAHDIRPRRDQFYEEVAPCPDCHPIEVMYWRHGDKVPFRTMDPATVRAALAG